MAKVRPAAMAAAWCFAPKSKPVDVNACHPVSINTLDSGAETQSDMDMDME